MFLKVMMVPNLLQGDTGDIHPKREVKIEGKMVADGIDASQGQDDDDNAGDWRPAVSRSTNGRFLRRKARRETYEASLKDDEQQDVNTEGEVIMEAECNVQTSDDRLVDEGVVC